MPATERDAAKRAGLGANSVGHLFSARQEHGIEFLQDIGRHPLDHLVHQLIGAPYVKEFSKAVEPGMAAALHELQDTSAAIGICQYAFNLQPGMAEAEKHAKKAPAKEAVAQLGFADGKVQAIARVRRSVLKIRPRR